MTPWTWECFSDLMQVPTLRVSDPGPLEAPVRSFTLVRDDERDLVLETFAVGETRNAAVEHPPGTVRRNLETARFESEVGVSAVAHGLSRRNQTRTRDADGRPECREVWSVQRLEVTCRANGTAAYTIDWLENLDDFGHWMGEMIKTQSHEPQTRTIGSGDRAIVLRTKGLQQDSHRHAALELEIGGVQLFLCSEEKMPGRVQPGYILYRGAPDVEFRKRIRNVLGFCIGSGLIYLGSTVLNARSQVLSTVAVSGNPFGDRIFAIGQRPPARLGTRYEYEVDQRELSRIAVAIYDHYDELDFGALSWAYWHAACAPVHMAAGHYGAAIEALRTAYAKSHPNPARGRIIQDKAKAQKAVRGMTDALAGLELDEETHQRLLNKVSNLNSASGALVAERIMDELNLPLGPDERAAWLRRNDAAHGKPPSEDEIVQLIRDTKLLRLVLHRLVLRISGASATYIDDYTVGHAVRPLAQPVPTAPL